MISAVTTRAVPNSIGRPEWTTLLSAPVDNRDFFPIGSLSVFVEDATMMIGDDIVSGLDEIADFFGKTDAKAFSLHANSLFNIFWPTGADEVEHHIVRGVYQRKTAKRCSSSILMRF